MRNLLIIIFMLLVLGGCSKEEKKEKDDNASLEFEDLIVDEKDLVDEYVDDNPIDFGIYMYYGSHTERKLLEEYTTNWVANVDLCSLEIYYTTDDFIPGTNQKALWNHYVNNYEDIDEYRIGYIIDFETANEGRIEKYILSPKDTDSIFGYIQIYLYDDIHQKDGAWYSHITEEEYNSESILSSIKLTGSSKTSEISSDIKLTVFTYDDDDFDSDNKYRGISKREIIIKRS